MTDVDYTTASTVPAVVSGRQWYSAGFLFDTTGRVVLIRKNRPTWQAGRLNGVGGHIEPGETPAEAMRREFAEEAGLDLPGWGHYATVTFPAGAVWFFRLVVAPHVLDTAAAATDEPLEVIPVAEACSPHSVVIPNLRWLLPLAQYTHDAYIPLVAAETALA